MKMTMVLFMSCIMMAAAVPAAGYQNPIAGRTLYAQTHTSAHEQAEEWEATRPNDAALMQYIAEQPQAKWIGDWNDTPRKSVRAYVEAASDAGALPVIVIYNIPYRDCGSYSSGGAESAAAYRLFIDRIARGIGETETVVIVEPDSLGAVSCLSDAQRTQRFNLLSYAVDALRTESEAVVYLDAGNANWVPAKTMARRLKKAGIAQANGFALNVSNFYKTKRTHQFGKRLSAHVGGKHFVIDTSRNGNGSNDGEWCNPSGRALGHVPTTTTAHRRVDALLWVKLPGESDGGCNGGPSAGDWWPEYALELAQNANI
jgi:endoglucanase